MLDLGAYLFFLRLAVRDMGNRPLTPHADDAHTIAHRLGRSNIPIIPTPNRTVLDLQHSNVQTCNAQLEYGITGFETPAQLDQRLRFIEDETRRALTAYRNCMGVQPITCPFLHISSLNSDAMAPPPATATFEAKMNYLRRWHEAHVVALFETVQGAPVVSLNQNPYL